MHVPYVCEELNSLAWIRVRCRGGVLGSDFMWLASYLLARHCSLDTNRSRIATDQALFNGA